MAYKWHILIVTLKTVWFFDAHRTMKKKNDFNENLKLLKQSNVFLFLVWDLEFQHIFCRWIAVAAPSEENGRAIRKNNHCYCCCCFLSEYLWYDYVKWHHSITIEMHGIHLIQSKVTHRLFTIKCRRHETYT